MREAREDQVEHWLSRLEILVPESINGISDQGELVIEHRYVPNSVRLVEFIQPDLEDHLTLCYLTVSYLVEKWEVEETILAPMVTMLGVVQIPVDHGFNMVLDDVSFRDGLVVLDR